MKPYTSLLLDVLRIGAALGVVLAHLGQTQFSVKHSYLASFGHMMVVIFFVLSGYIIAYTSARCASLQDYALARLSRLLSCLWPCLIITLLLLLIGRSINPALYSQFDRGHEAIRFILSAFFMNETWWLSAAPPSNPPLWSLAYEFWYYAFFGAWMFIPNRRIAMGICLALGLIAGPKILMLFPIWLLGVCVYYLQPRLNLSRNHAKHLLIILSLLWGTVFIQRPSWPSEVGYAPYFFSASWASDFIFALLTAGCILLFNSVASNHPAPEWPRRWISQRCPESMLRLRIECS